MHRAIKLRDENKGSGINAARVDGMTILTGQRLVYILK